VNIVGFVDDKFDITFNCVKIPVGVGKDDGGEADEGPTKSGR
jgi:hypothetical protein